MALEVEEAHTYYGMSHILFGVSLRVGPHEVVALMGRNGAGKTTTLRTIMGLTPPSSGSITYNGDNLVGRPTFEIARRGIGFVPEDRRVFPFLTVRENLEVATKPPLASGGRAWTAERVFSLFPQLRQLEHRRAGTLSGGEQQMLTIARTLMGNPDLILLDEPSEGLAPLVVEHLLEQLYRLREEGLAILLSEQNVDFALELCDRVYVIDKGEIRFEGTVDEFHENEGLRHTYLAV
jgi:branched-chain amino acid transport system ATP-binding protein